MIRGPRLTRCGLRELTYLLATVLALVFLGVTYKDDLNEIPDRWHAPFLNPEPQSSLDSPTKLLESNQEGNQTIHPIDELIPRFEAEFKQLLEKETAGVAAAAQAYRTRRGRHPPPEFDRWVRFAEEKNCLVIEELFDQIYHDLDPFWAIPSHDIRTAASNLPNYVRIRNRTALKSDGTWNFVNQYYDLLKSISSWLPDVDIPINEMDESRLLVPWEDINKYISSEAASAPSVPAQLPSVDSYSSLTENKSSEYNYAWISQGPYWDIAKAVCPPASPAREAMLDMNFSTPPQFPNSWPSDTYKGYVSNWTIAKDPCIHAHLRNMHGTFVEPISQRTSTKLFPIFSGSKLPMNNDILLPAAVYWSEEDRFSAGSVRIPWQTKRNEVTWRGTASGGRNTVRNWTRFQRHRLLSMLNGTQIQMTLEANANSYLAASARPSSPQNFPLPNQTLYPLRSHALGLLPEWIRSISNTAFTWLTCFPPTRNYACSYTGAWYRRGREMPMHRMFRAKYLPDVDGNSFSGRYRAFLKSNSLPIKATIYSEWHDSRLIPWVHFVPMDNTFVDLWAVLEWLFGNDEKAEKIAEQGREWAERVLRKEDMVVYVYRLVLEYARVSDERRRDMGFAGDLVAGG